MRVGCGVPESVRSAEQAALEWAAGQTGHPWDSLTVESDGECVEVSR